MGWKDFSYWLKGGIIGLIFSILLFFLTFKIPSCWDWGNPTPIYCHILFPINGTIGGTPGLLSLILYILYGAVIGWIIGKVKNK